MVKTPKAKAAKAVTAQPKARKARKPMTAAAKKAISLRMRKYWASRRGEK